MYVGQINEHSDSDSDATFIRCKLHCERGKLFLSMLGGAAYDAVSRDFRSTSPSFLSESLWLSIERAFKFKGLYFDFVYIMAEMLHDVNRYVI